MDDDFDDEEVWHCGVCDGPVESLGCLGRIEHGRCQNCGMDQHREAEVKSEDQEG